VVHFSIGEVLYRQKKLTEAIAAYHRVIELDQKHFGSAAFINIGGILRGWGLLEEAAGCFRKAIAIDNPRSTFTAQRLLGEILQQQNKLDEAVIVFSKVIELEPNSPISHNALAWILANRPEVNLRNPKRAVELAKKAVQLVPKNRIFWQTLGYAEYRAGNWKSAITALEKVKELGSPGDSLEWFPLAMAHWKLGDKDQARALYDKASEWMDKNLPKNEELRRFREEAAELLELKEKK
jgi:tetratricopeptide (TPR) repeat protein